MTKPADVDEYIANIEREDYRAALRWLRSVILDEIPNAREVISYGIPTYKQGGFVASFAAFKKHCSFFPGYVVRDFADQLSGFKISKGTIQFCPERPIPEPLIRAMLRVRLVENASRAAHSF